MNGFVEALAVDSNDDLYVGGDFFEAGSGATTANYIAKWDGTSWSALDGGVSGGFVRALAVDSNDDLYVGGYFTTAGGQISMNLGRWFERVFLVYLPIGT